MPVNNRLSKMRRRFFLNYYHLQQIPELFSYQKAAQSWTVRFSEMFFPGSYPWMYVLLMVIPMPTIN